ncbi:Receptor expression-enhancing protein 5 [Trichinella pseudospiralis]|uniref:Receptor expression-enhancing protein 5 n=1 Tax=Trichinella pseudospiralis TaxID=6337 RepID=A0A0V1DTW8_TRIPS|nr:Receptor expression-enhancing protein 5 [Trichinella pseudospiralis]
MANIVKHIWADITNAISDENTLVEKVFGKVEEKSSRSRYQVALYGYWHFTSAEVLRNLISFCYLAMKMVMEIEDKGKINFNQWMLYWIVFGFHIFLFYWLLKCIFFLWLFMASCCVAGKLYEKLLHFCYSQFFLFSNPGKEITITE